MSIWLKAAIYSLAGAILGTMIIGTLFSGADTMNSSDGPGYGNTGFYQPISYVTAVRMGMNQSRCMNRR